MASRADGDIVRDVASELPLRVMLRVCGAPAEDFERSRHWADGGAALMGVKASEAEQVRAASNVVALWEYCQELTSARATGAGDDLWSDLRAHRAVDDAALPDREVASIAFDP